jgi:ribosomal protein L32
VNVRFLSGGDKYESIRLEERMAQHLSECDICGQVILDGHLCDECMEALGDE